MDKTKLEHSEPLFRQCSLLTIQDRIKLRTGTMVYKSIHNQTPSYLTEFFTEKSTVSCRVTRSSDNTDELYVPNFKLTVTRKTLRYNGAKYYNSLDNSIKSAKSAKSFKTMLYKALL